MHRVAEPPLSVSVEGGGGGRGTNWQPHIVMRQLKCKIAKNCGLLSIFHCKFGFFDCILHYFIQKCTVSLEIKHKISKLGRSRGGGEGWGGPQVL